MIINTEDIDICRKRCDEIQNENTLNRNSLLIYQQTNENHFISRIFYYIENRF